MIAILKREMKSYFSSPVGYVCVAALTALYGLYYYQLMLFGSTANVGQIVYGTMFMFTMMIIPILTMKSMSEDKKNKTDQALLTAPVSVTSIVTGKFLAAFGVYLIATTIGLFPAMAMESFSNPPWGIIFGNYIATLMYGAGMISIGVFISSLTESQVIAAIGTFIVSMFLLFVDGMASSIGGIAGQIIKWISFNDRYTVYTTGMFSVPSTIFFLSVTAIFIFLTARKLESRRWN